MEAKMTRSVGVMIFAVAGSLLSATGAFAHELA
jgi:hypothetical protein